MDFYEFFAGAGTVRLGLGANWNCLFSNDFDTSKARAYRTNFGHDVLRCADIATLDTEDLPGRADLAWASFPCVDLSSAGVGAGISGMRSSVFWDFWRLMEGLCAQGHGPSVVVIENVPGLATSNGGTDIVHVCRALAGTGYRYGPLIVDAALFVPQSRPRLFIIAARDDVAIPRELRSNTPSPMWHPRPLRGLLEILERSEAARWVWWRLHRPPRRQIHLHDLIEEASEDAVWDDMSKTKRLLEMMSGRSRERIRHAQRAGTPVIGCAYRRIRSSGIGKIQVAEVRTDGLAGCLRMPTGGSSRQIVIRIEGDEIRSRLLSPREAARLMGIPDSYRLPSSFSHAYGLAADAVVVPAVRFLAQAIIEPLLRSNAGAAAAETQSRGKKVGRPRKHPDRVLTSAERSAAHRQRRALLGFGRMTVEVPNRERAAINAVASLIKWVHLHGRVGDARKRDALTRSLTRSLSPVLEHLGLCLTFNSPHLEVGYPRAGGSVAEFAARIADDDTGTAKKTATKKSGTRWLGVAKEPHTSTGRR